MQTFQCVYSRQKDIVPLVVLCFSRSQCNGNISSHEDKQQDIRNVQSGLRVGLTWFPRKEKQTKRNLHRSRFAQRVGHIFVRPTESERTCRRHLQISQHYHMPPATNSQKKKKKISSPSLPNRTSSLLAGESRSASHSILVFNRIYFGQ